MLDIYGTLEINRVLEQIASYSRSELSKDRILSLKMLPKDIVKSDLEILDEMMSYLLRFGDIALSSSFDLKKYLDEVEKGGVLTASDLDKVANDIDSAIKINKQFAKIDKSKYFRLFSLADSLFDLTPLGEKIHKVVLPNLTISDEASPTLRSIRNSINKKEQELRALSGQLIQKYHDYLSESSLSIRDGHFVLPVKTSYKNKVDGIIHDFSSSGQTTFIEPSILVNLSNQIYALKNDEQEEIYKLLKELSLQVGAHSNEVYENNKILAEFDYIAAKAKYCNEYKCLVAELSDERVIDIKGARHPLLDQTKVVANDFHFDNETRLIIISGPNAGGKTVALKTLGILVMMNQMGIAIPTSSQAKIAYFPRIYADIGDNQSLSDNLSTFAAHVSNLSTITHFVNADDLVLLDELGTGTSPNEGSSLALAISDFLIKKNCFALVSSHYEAMKEYPYRNKASKNAMMVFDEKKLEPTYVLRIGYPGRSYGLEMAKRYHLDNRVIEDSKKYLQKASTKGVNDVLDKLNNVLRENELLEKNLLKKTHQIESKEKDLKYREKVLKEQKENLLSDVEEEKEQLIKDAKKQIDKLINSKNSNVKVSELLKLKQELDTLFVEEEPKEIKEDISLGDYVLISSLDIVGKVTSINKNKIEIISRDGVSYKTTLDKVEITEAPKETFSKKNNVDEVIKNKADVKLELNIIGEHVDDALAMLSKYLDDARIRNFKEVRIIHGMGTGALRGAVHDYLAKCSFVEEYHLGGAFDGSSGATIVKLK